MTDKTFSVRSNAIRNARGALGKGAKQGIHFTVGGEKGAFTWSPVADAPAVASASVEAAKVAVAHPSTDARRPVTPSVKRIKAKVKARVAAKKATGQKVGRKPLKKADEVSGKRLTMFKLISGAHGASLDTLTNRLEWQKHTVRGAVSTIASQFGVKIKSYRHETRGRVYQVVSRKAA
jgi:hypothetical protein